MAVPLTVWLVLATCGTVALLCAQAHARDAVVQRFEQRLGLVAKYVTNFVTDLTGRELSQAKAMLADPVVTWRDFSRVAIGFGDTSALLLDEDGRVLQVYPEQPGMIGQNVAARYAHLRAALDGRRPTVSRVVLSVSQKTPVVAFAVPFKSSSSSRWRVFSGAVAITGSPLSSYLNTAWTSGFRAQLVDSSGAVAAANRPLTAERKPLSSAEPGLARALADDDRGRYRSGDTWWRYASLPIAGTPWRLSATVPEDVLFATVLGSEIGSRIAVGVATGVGLLVVAAWSRARRHWRDLAASEQRFRNVFDQSRIGMFVVSPDGRLLRVNPAFGRMLGRAPDELARFHFADITHPDDAPRCLVAQRDCLTGRIDSFELAKRYLHADGHAVEVDVTCALMRDPDGEPQFFAVQVIDMTERHALERARDRQQAELAERAEQLQQVNSQMTDFIAMLTHDVRQPLAGIVAGGELLLEEWPELGEDERIAEVRRMTGAGHRADQLVTEILTLAQLDAGAMVARQTRIDLSTAVPEAVAAYYPALGQHVTFLAPDQCVAFADPAHLQLILGNLVGNAAKYGAPPITVRVTHVGGHAEIQVSDNGEGVPDAFVPHLFDRFARAETGVAVTKPGTGLGLYLVRQLADAGGITVAYRPNEPRGSTFVLKVPKVPTSYTGRLPVRGHSVRSL